MAERDGGWTAQRRTWAWLGLGLGIPLTLIGVLAVAFTGHAIWAWVIVMLGVALVLVGLFAIPTDGRRDSGGAGGLVVGDDTPVRKAGEDGWFDFGGGGDGGGGGGDG